MKSGVLHILSGSTFGNCESEVEGYRTFSRNATIGDILVTLRLDGALAVAGPADAEPDPP